MFNPLKVTSKQITDTNIVLAFVLIIIGLHFNMRLYFFAAGALLLFTLIIPRVFKPVTVAWFGISKVLEWITSRLLLGILFYFLVTPVGVLRRILGKDRLQLKGFKNGSATAFTKRKHFFIREDLEMTY